MGARILVVDSDAAFAAMLKDLLEEDGGHTVDVARDGREALAALRRAEFALTIVDMGLEPGGNAYLELLHAVRQSWPSMRLVLIPFGGEDLPPEARRVDIQGVLSKPFFADDLLPAIEEALTRRVTAAAPTPPLSPPPAPAARLQPVAVEPRPAAGTPAVLASLARETGADLALYLSMAGGREELLGQASTFGKSVVEALTGPVAAAVRAAQAAGRALGQANVPFEHNMFESGTIRLYVMVLPGDRLLLVMTPIGTPLGMVRTNLRRAARDLGV